LKNRKEDSNEDDNSYFAIGRHKSRENILKIGVPTVGAMIVLGVVFSIQLSAQGTMGKMVLLA
jgi:hypothetical protein